MNSKSKKELVSKFSTPMRKLKKMSGFWKTIELFLNFIFHYLFSVIKL